jgi:hypothetical protein
VRREPARRLVVQVRYACGHGYVLEAQAVICPEPARSVFYPATLAAMAPEPAGPSEVTHVTGVVEASTPTGVRIEGLWYSFPRNLDARPPDRGARVELHIGARRFVTALKVLAPAPSPAEADRPIVRASVLKAAAHFCATRRDPSLRSRRVVQIAAVWEAWIYQPTILEHDGVPTRAEPDKDERIARQVALTAVVDFLGARPQATADDVLPIAEDWLVWLHRAAADTAHGTEQSPSPSGAGVSGEVGGEAIAF